MRLSTDIVPGGARRQLEDEGDLGQKRPVLLNYLAFRMRHPGVLGTRCPSAHLSRLQGSNAVSVAAQPFGHFRRNLALMISHNGQCALEDIQEIFGLLCRVSAQP